jgi:hypothetical protein
MLPQPLLGRWPPGDQLNPETIINHGESAGCQRASLPIGKSQRLPPAQTGGSDRFYGIRS